MNVLILQMLLNKFRNHFVSSLKDNYQKSEINALYSRLTDFFFQWPSTFSFLNSSYELNSDEFKKLSLALEDLKKFRPIQYIINESYFYGRSFYVDENVFIPRPETEDLVEWVLADFKDHEDNCNLLELGTGSGCIAISLAKEQSKFNIEALDISMGALGVAQKNALNHDVKIEFIHQDMMDLSIYSTPLNIMISNPPYIDPEEKKVMLPNVLDYEPHSAIFTPKKNPLYFYNKIILLAQSFLVKNGCLYLEINPKFQKALLNIIKTATFKDIEMRNDIFGKKRMLKAIKS